MVLKGGRGPPERGSKNLSGRPGGARTPPEGGYEQPSSGSS